MPNYENFVETEDELPTTKQSITSHEEYVGGGHVI